MRLRNSDERVVKEISLFIGIDGNWEKLHERMIRPEADYSLDGIWQTFLLDDVVTKNDKQMFKLVMNTDKNFNAIYEFEIWGY